MNTIEKSSGKEGYEVLMLSEKKKTTQNEEASDSDHLTDIQTKYLATYFKKEETVFVRRFKGAKREACDSSITEHKLKVSHDVIAAPRSHLSKPGVFVFRNQLQVKRHLAACHPQSPSSLHISVQSCDRRPTGRAAASNTRNKNIHSIYWYHGHSTVNYIFVMQQDNDVYAAGRKYCVTFYKIKWLYHIIFPFPRIKWHTCPFYNKCGVASSHLPLVLSK